ncbi:hypothetical protein ACFUJU_25325 [Streptomyces sp. NPDC057235]|uniref:hypothetical protein n=1 Tax=Streptomyces sp. NPDC057235 TaxID=3346058 RepID=UPI00362F9D62
MVDAELARLAHLDDVVVGDPLSAGQPAAGRHGRLLDGFGGQDLVAGVAAVGGIQAGVPVPEGGTRAAGAALLGDGESADGVLQRQHRRNRRPAVTIGALAALAVLAAVGEERASGVRARQNAAVPRGMWVITPVDTACPDPPTRRARGAHRPGGASEFGGEMFCLVVHGFTREDETVRGHP